MTETSWLETPAFACMIVPPRAKPPNRSAASTMPIGEFFPRSATAMASKPYPEENPSNTRWNTPETWIIPARPANPPAMAMAMTVRDRGSMPACAAARAPRPTARSS